MSTPNPILSTIIFVFALQAIILSVMLYTKKPRILSRKLLSILVFFFALMAFNIALVNVLLNYDLFYVFRYVQLELMFGIGPALYFYTKSITDRNFTLNRKDYLHFIPVVLEFLFYRTAFYRLGADGLYQSETHPYTKIYLAEQWLGVISITVYTLLSLRILFNYQSWLKQNYSNIEDKSLVWIRTPILIFSFYWIGWNVLSEIDQYFFERTLRDFYFLPSFTGLAIITCWIGFKGYLHPYEAIAGYSNRRLKTIHQEKDEEFKQYFTDFMKSKSPHLDPNLDLTTLSEQLDMKPKQVSHQINHSFDANFYELINRYRVESFIHRLKKSDSKKYTLLGLAYECGFKSKSTFNHAFKKMIGKTPSQYNKEMKKESERKHSVA